MGESLSSRLKHAWNVFLNREPTADYVNVGPSYYYRPDRPVLTRGNDRTIVTAVYNRIAMDVAAIDIRHVKLDENDRFIKTIDSGLNNCLSLEANIDQTNRAFIQDVVLSMLDEGVVAIVPVDTSINPRKSSSYEIETMRVGKITAWYPEHVQVRLYNQKTGLKEDIVLPKKMVAIVENPLYSVINDCNSVLQRLVRKLALLDVVDEQSSSGKLNMIIQLPYVIKTEARKQQAETRRRDIEQQLTESKFGIAYTDGTEKITQLGHPLENTLMEQVEYLTSMLYSQLGITKEVMDGTAAEQVMLNYTSRTIEPILSAIVDEMKRKFLTKTARTQRQSIQYFMNPFRLIPMAQIASVADTFTRNEILSSNEIRQIIGMPPSKNPEADELRNKNMPVQDQPTTADVPQEEMVEEPYEEVEPEEEYEDSEFAHGLSEISIEDLMEKIQNEEV